jgi:hypothetical protein
MDGDTGRSRPWRHLRSSPPSPSPLVKSSSPTCCRSIEDPAWFAPDVVPVEAADAWWAKRRRKDLTSEEVEQSIANLLALQIRSRWSRASPCCRRRRASPSSSVTPSTIVSVSCGEQPRRTGQFAGQHRRSVERWSSRQPAMLLMGAQQLLAPASRRPPSSAPDQAGPDTRGEAAPAAKRGHPFSASPRSRA